MPLNFLSYQTTFLPLKSENFKFSNLSGKISGKQTTPYMWEIWWTFVIEISELKFRGMRRRSPILVLAENYYVLKIIFYDNPNKS